MTVLSDVHVRVLAALWGTAALAIATVLRLAFEDGQRLPDRLVVVLIGAAALCVAWLAVRRLPAVAWAASIAAAWVGLIESVAAIRGSGAAATRAALTGPLVAADMALGVTLALAATFAWRSWGTTGRRERYARGLVTLGTVVALGAIVTDVVTLVTHGPAALVWEKPAARAVTSLGLWLTLVFLFLGATGAIQPPLERARRRLDSEGGPEQVPGGRRRRLLDLLVDELLVPLRAAQVAAAREAERARLAADLHAIVLPELRTAFQTATAEGASGQVAARLRDTVDDVESLMAGAHSPVLERFGLVAALEWLAERTEARSRVRVAIDVADTADAASSRRSPARATAEAERAAFRVALLAVDNVVRHADGAAVRIEVRSGPTEVLLSIADDGPGVREDTLATSIHAGRRGLEDMRAEARRCGADVTITPRHGGPGTLVRFHLGSR